MAQQRRTGAARAGRRAVGQRDELVADVLVIGGGISGIQASLDLANSAFKVCLIDKAPAIGGHMAQLDKVFPTNDCSMCIESPKLIECNRHPNIDILTCTEIDGLDGDAGEFTATLIRKPRYVLEDRCRGCGTCSRYCPVHVPDPFNENLSDAKAIRVSYPQAAPLVSRVDADACLFLLEEKCGICGSVCKDHAIDLNQKEERVELHVGAVILALGYEAFDPRQEAGHIYDGIPNVVTSLEFERILNSDGPYRGELVRPSDGRSPKRIAWIQCVGSRCVTPGGASYCSAVCCMYAMKQMILAQERRPDLEATIFHNDIRAFGKEFEQFHQRARELPGARFVRSYVSIGRQLSERDNVSIRFTSGGSVAEEEFDLAVLSVGLRPPKGIEELSGKLGIELNRHGFCKSADSNPLRTSRRGVFASGAFLGPMDIPESVVSGGGAAALCGQMLASRRGRLAERKTYPPERDLDGEDPRVGVFVCDCGTNIGGVVDVPAVVDYARSLDHVVHAEEMLFACSADAAQQMRERIAEEGLNRVVVAACTPRTHEPLFRETLREAGINRYCFVMANIREHSSWVHSREKDKATGKAKDKVRMSVARARELIPLREVELPVVKRGLVVGGGLAGMTSGLALANLGFEVFLVEKSAALGGISRRLHRTINGMDVKAHLADLARRVHENPLVHILTGSEVVATTGCVGNYTTRAVRHDRETEIHHGVTIIATGAEEHEPTEYLYGKSDRVVTLLELEEKIARREAEVLGEKSMAILLCVGCREEGRPHCSRICCSQAIKCALQARALAPSMEIYVLYRDMRTYGFLEDYYAEAASQNVRFIRYTADEKPVIEAGEHDGDACMKVTISDPLLRKKLVLEAGIVALAAAVVPSADSERISKLFKAPLSRDGFFLEAHMKLRPVDFATEGVFLCGAAQYPKTVAESIAQAQAAAGRASVILSQDVIVSSGTVCAVDQVECRGCGLCEKVCQFGAIELLDSPDGKKGGKKSRVVAVSCQGCGACNSVCPTGAISQSHFTDAQVLAEVGTAFPDRAREDHFEPRVLAFLCNWCGYAGSDMAGVSRIQYAPTTREVRVMCSSRISPRFVMEAFLQGADGVLVCGCNLGDCHYIKANEQTEKMIETATKALKKVGIDAGRLRHEYVSAAEGARYAEKVDAFTDFLTGLGPLEMGDDQKSEVKTLKLGSIGKRAGTVSTH